MKQVGKTFSIIPIVTSLIVLPLNLLIFLTVLFEQINTGWGYGTDFDIFIIFLAIGQIITILPLLCSLTFTILSCVLDNNIKKKIINIILLLFNIICLILTNVFIVH